MISVYYTSDDLNGFIGKIQEKWDQGLRLVDVEYVEEVWVGEFEYDFGENSYSYSINFDDFTGQIQQQWDQGLDLVDVEYGDGGVIKSDG